MHQNENIPKRHELFIEDLSGLFTKVRRTLQVRRICR
jgi:hypothetical protein